MFKKFLMTAASLAGCLFASNAWADAEALIGEPFGVGRVTLALPAGSSANAIESNAFSIDEADGRALYPVFSTGRILGIIGNLLGNPAPAAPDSVTIHFLFTGAEPLELTVLTPAPRTITVQPQLPRSPRAHERLLTRWWRSYDAHARQQIEQGDYPPLIETYLSAMLGRRLRLEQPLLSRVGRPAGDENLDTLKLLAGAESLHLEILRQRNLAPRINTETAHLPPPPEIVWNAPQPPPVDGPIDIEPIALRVPHECFYVRFGTFDNYIWMDKLQREYGGDIARMITLRGFDPKLTARAQKQLALKQSALSEIFGGSVIKDVALIGRDLNLREGAALGVLFEARNEGALAAELSNQRTLALKEHANDGISIETLKIAGRDVSFLSSSDNRVRSYHVADGAFHLVTNSRKIAERFLAVRDGRGSLGASAEFQHARYLMPTSRDDTIFVYFSSAFFEGLLSPQYQIELRRRLDAVADIESVRLARLAAFAERKPDHSLEELVAGDLLPNGFGRRPDGSGPILAGDEVVDSMRGWRGSFTPIPDVPIDGVTPSEAARWAQQRAFFGESWREMDPLMAGVKRFALDDRDIQRVVIDANIAPFVEEKYGWLTSILGPPTTTRVTPAAGDIITVQAMVKGGLISPSIPPHLLFVGVQDNVPLTDLRSQGLLKTLQIIRTTPGYLGAWPKTGFLDWLPLGLGGGAPDAYGFSQLPLGLWRRQWDAFSALSFDPNLLARVTPQLAIEETDSQAQVRIFVGDLSQAKLRAWVNQLTYWRARQASVGNTRLLHLVTQQFNVPRDQALVVVEDLLDASLVCSLGGEYQLVEYPSGDVIWSSDKLRTSPLEGPPDEYVAPLLGWFRGANAALTKYDEAVVMHATVDIQRQPDEPPPKITLPFFNLFGGRGNAETDGSPKPAADGAPKTAPNSAAPNADSPNPAPKKDAPVGREF